MMNMTFLAIDKRLDSPDRDINSIRSTVMLCILIAVGAVLRILACYWGYPYQLHPDEAHTVNSAINMISRRSYEVGVYSRPDHFEIKGYALLFQIVSYIKYHISADVAFPEHRMVFYLIARAYTAFFGVLSIGLTYKILEKIRPQAKLIAAGIVTFFPIFVQHSAYATPDIVLAFFVLLITYFSILFLEKPSIIFLTLICVATGIGITVKYTCAIACIWIAIVVCVDCVRRKQYLDIVKLGIFSITVVFASCFFAAPNLFTNIQKTINDGLLANAASTHLGADGLGFGGNFKYYLSIFLSSAGYETLVCILAGILFCLKTRDINTLSIGIGLLFWVCTSVLALHWVRWGMPIYLFFVILETIGITYLFELAKKKWIRSVIIILGFVMICNSVVSGILIVQGKLTTAARVDAIQFCENNEITEENALYDGYTPFLLSIPATINVSFDEQGNVSVPSGIQYLIISSDIYDRYYTEPERYASEVNMYNNIQNKCELIYNAGGNYYTHSNIGIANILQGIKGFVSHNSSTVGGNDDVIEGETIKIYRILGDAQALSDFL